MQLWQRVPRQLAEAELNPELFQALEWPCDIREYEDYLKRFVRWAPHESDAGAWKNEKRLAQEVEVVMRFDHTAVQ